jgi:hypothetical protein
LNPLYIDGEVCVLSIRKGLMKLFNSFGQCS